MNILEFFGSRLTPQEEYISELEEQERYGNKFPFWKSAANNAVRHLRQVDDEDDGA
jgi:hypothetical protein